MRAFSTIKPSTDCSQLAAVVMFREMRVSRNHQQTNLSGNASEKTTVVRISGVLAGPVFALTEPAPCGGDATGRPDLERIHVT